jgi:hypothetical protein
MKENALVVFIFTAPVAAVLALVLWGIPQLGVYSCRQGFAYGG